MSAPVKPMTLWLTGRPCSGKTTLALRLRRHLDDLGVRSVNLDGDELRGGLNADLGFSDSDRNENLRRAAHVAELFNKNGIWVICAFVSPTDQQRKLVRSIIKEFTLCYVRCSLKLCETRDVKGMYKKARSGMIKDFTGVGAPYEEPNDSEITVNTDTNTEEECTRQILKALEFESLQRIKVAH